MIVATTLSVLLLRRVNVYMLLHQIPLPPDKERVFANFCKGFMRYILVKVVERYPTGRLKEDLQTEQA